MAYRLAGTCGGFIASAVCACLAASAPLQAGESAGRPHGVVELFTSEGCSSCPPADKVLAELADAGNVVALAFHVDYWDYLGWEDTLATEANTERQKRYAEALNKSIYTPEAVINGRADVIGSHAASIRNTVTGMAKAGKGLSVPVTLSRTADSVVVEIGAAPNKAAEAEVVLLSFLPERTVPIRSGENKGSAIRYVNSVTHFQTIGMWHGEARRYEMPLNAIRGEGRGIAVLVQTMPHDAAPAIIGAAISK
jgi:hypothetical protein